MTGASLTRLRRSYDLFVPHVGRMTERFYDRLFAARPETRILFATDMAAQRQHLAAALALIVRNLSMLDALEQPLMDLGAGHARIGVRAEDYPVVRDAMLAAIAEELGTAWTPELADDWSSLLDRVCRHMIAGSDQNAGHIGPG
jgi:nitric oxide dioxygenase